MFAETLAVARVLAWLGIRHTPTGRVSAPPLAFPLRAVHNVATDADILVTSPPPPSSRDPYIVALIDLNI